jgi:hypothetical protein
VLQAPLRCVHPRHPHQNAPHTLRHTLCKKEDLSPVAIVTEQRDARCPVQAPVALLIDCQFPPSHPPCTLSHRRCFWGTMRTSVCSLCTPRSRRVPPSPSKRTWACVLASLPTARASVQSCDYVQSCDSVQSYVGVRGVLRYTFVVAGTRVTLRCSLEAQRSLTLPRGAAPRLCAVLDWEVCMWAFGRALEVGDVRGVHACKRHYAFCSLDWMCRLGSLILLICIQSCCF